MLYILSNAFDFLGIVGRKKYWLSILACILESIAISVILYFGIPIFSNSVFKTASTASSTFALSFLNGTSSAFSMVITLLLTIFSIWFYIGSLSAMTRRIRDAGFPGWLIIIPFLLNLITIAVFVLLRTMLVLYILSAISGIASIALFVMTLLPSKEIATSQQTAKTADDVLLNELDKVSSLAIEREERVENEFGHKLDKKGLQDQIINVAKESDLHSFIYLLEGKTTEEDFVKRRLKNALLTSLVVFICEGLLYGATIIFDIDVTFNVLLMVFIDIILALAMYKLDYLLLKNRASAKQNEVKEAFPLWMSMLEVLVVTNNIPNTLKKSYDACPRPIKKDLKNLIAQLERDPIDKVAYSNFLKQYNLPEVSEIVMDLYQFNFLDKNKISTEFSALHNRVNRIKSDTRKARQKSEIFIVGALNSVSLMVVSIYIMMVSNLLSSVIM